MGTIEGRYFKSSGIVNCKLLEEFFISFASVVTVSFESDQGRQVVTSGYVDRTRNDAKIRSVRPARGVCRVSHVELGASDLAILLSGVTDSNGQGDARLGRHSNVSSKTG